MQSYNIIVTGSAGSGKTTFIKSISEVPVFSTPHLVLSPHGESLQVAVDFGRLTVSEGIFLYFSGTPSRDEFRFLWERLSPGLLGFIVLVNLLESESIEETQDTIEYLKLLEDVPFVVVLNRLKDHGASTVEKIKKNFAVSNHQISPCDARNKKEVKEAVLTLLSFAEKHLAFSSK